MKTLLTLLLCVTAVLSSDGQAHEFQWLVGRWKLDGKKAYETWIVEPGTNRLTGRSFRIQNMDTLITETVLLDFYDGSYHYIPDVAGDQGPVNFRIVAFDDHSFVAENPQHDFPKRITYHYFIQAGLPKLNASVEGHGRVISYQFSKLE